MNRILSMGMNGPEVYALQTKLNRSLSGLTPLSVDGVFCARTRVATVAHQRRSGLVPDGVVGPATWVTLPQVLTSESEAEMCCGNVNPMHAASLNSARRAMRAAPATKSAVRVPKLRRASKEEKRRARAVFGQSIDFSTVFLSDQTGINGRPFVIAVPNPSGEVLQIMNIGPEPSPDRMIHELGHVWQSQHHSQAGQFMINAVASQGLAEAVNGLLGGKLYSAYAYVPGAAFGHYGAEQIAQQIMRGEATIIDHVRSVAARKVDACNVASLATPRIQDSRVEGARR
jgi:hypothetical protein